MRRCSFFGRNWIPEGGESTVRQFCLYLSEASLALDVSIVGADLVYDLVDLALHYLTGFLPLNLTLPTLGE